MADFYAKYPVTGGGGSGTVTEVTADAPLTVTDGTTTPNLSIPKATSSVDGYLSSTDWTTFNNKGSGTVTEFSFSNANGFAGVVTNATTTPGLVMTVSVSGILQGNGTAISAASTTGSGNVVLAASPTLTGTPLAPTATLGTNTTQVATTAFVQSAIGAIPNASTSTTGLLTSTDWNTFNNKQDSGSYITALTGDATASGPGSAALTLATVNSNTGSFGSSTAIPSFTVNAKGLITAASTNAVIAPAGTLTGTTLASNVVSSSLTSVGTIASGTWNGSVLALAYGGTNNGSLAATAGGVIYTDGTKLVNVGAGTSGQFLKSNGSSAPGWADVTVTNSVAAKTANYTLTASDYLITASASGGAITLTLPTAVGASGKIYVLKRTDQTLGNAITIATTSSQTIDGSTTTTLMTQYEQISVISDGSNWQLLDRFYPGTWTSYTPTITGWGTVSIEGCIWRRVGNCIEIKATIVSGTVSSTTWSQSLPSGLTVDSSLNASTTDTNSCGLGYNVTSVSGNASTAAGPFVAFSDTSVSSSVFYMSRTNSGGRFAKDNGNAIIGNTERARIHVISLPITNWK